MEVIQRIDCFRGKIRILFESGWEVWLGKKLELPFRVAEGTEVDRDSFKQFILLHQYPPALEKAVSMLAQRARSRKEIQERLRFAHYDEEVISLVIYKLEQENLLNDQEFSKQWVQSRMKKYGSARIARELRMKGLNQETVNAALGPYSEEDELHCAVSLAEKKIRSMRSEADNKVLIRRVTEMMVRRGYSWNIAKKAVELVLDTEESC